MQMHMCIYTHTYVRVYVCIFVWRERGRDRYVCIYVCLCVCVCIHILPSINTELVGHMPQISCTLRNVTIASETLSALQVLKNNKKACFFPASLETLVVNVYRISIMQFAVLHN